MCCAGHIPERPFVLICRYNDMAREDASTQMPVERPLTSGEATVRKLLAGGLAGAVSKSCVAPLERLTTIMMADAPGQGMLMSLKNMWRDGGLLGMWSGNAATLAKIFPQTAIQFAAFHTLKEAISANSLVRHWSHWCPACPAPNQTMAPVITLIALLPAKLSLTSCAP